MKVSIIDRIKKGIAALALGGVLLGTLSPQQASATYYEYYLDDYSMYEALSVEYPEYEEYFDYQSYAYLFYYFAGYYADLVCYFSEEGTLAEMNGGYGAYLYDDQAYLGDYFWSVYI